MCLKPLLKILFTRMAPALAVTALFVFSSSKAVDSAWLSLPSATVSGNIRHNSSPVAGVEVQVNWQGGGMADTTDGSGAYSLSGVPIGGWIQIFVRPPVAMRLEFRNYGVSSLTGNLVQDFDLQDGWLLQGEFHQPDGTLFDRTFWLQTNPVNYMPPAGEWLGETAFNGQFQVVLPPDEYLLNPDPLPLPYFMPRTKVDLKMGDVTGLVITLLAERPPAVPTTPPNASLITISSPHSDGVATVTGSAGAVGALTDVVVVNLNAKSLAHTFADASGGFNVNVFAPPGSTLMVKYDPDGWRTAALLNAALNSSSAVTYLEFNPLPGTIINVGAPPAAPGNTQDFTAAGGFVVDPAASTHGKWAGWWLSGQVTAPAGPPLAADPGQPVTLNNLVLHVTSPAFDCSGTPAIDVNLNIGLRYLFAEDGSPHPWGAWFTAYLFTPTGLPIEHEAWGETVGVRNVDFTSFTCDGPHAAVSAPLQTDFTVPDDQPAGTYQIQGWLATGDVPQAEVADAPFVLVWYHFAYWANLPVIAVGDALPPHIPWTLLGDYPIDGRRGIPAREDEGIYAMPDRVVTSPEQNIIPREDPRTGKSLVYRLEPGSHWVSATDRRFPNPPTVPLEPDTGWLMVTIAKPNGSFDTLGPADFSQTSQRTPVTLDGNSIAEGTGQIDDLYHLTTRDSTFDYSFDQYGHHVIVLEGEVEDIYGRMYPIYATYDVYVARLLDLDPAQLPTTPYMIGDAFAPGLHLFPPVPAEVSVELTHLPYSDPVHGVTTIVTGQANDYGYFQHPAGTEIRFEQPGEFRVDITAIYTDTDGTLWMGSQTWGSVVEGENAQIEAHGRRGMDYHTNTVDDMPTWFEVFNLPPEKVGIENYYPYFSGDIHWGNEDKSPGDSIHSIITIKDLTPGGDIYDILLNNYPRSRNGFRWPPDDTSLIGLQKRLDVDEAPLFLSTFTGHDAGVFPGEIDQWAYWYGSSERPDVHVREIISEDNMGTAYWRFNDTYNMQIGEGAMGDLPGDLKWEFGGAVFRVPAQGIAEYAIYSSLWVLLPHGDPVGARVTPPFQDATGAGINGGPIMILNGQEIDMLFLPKGVRPGDILEVGDTVSFSGHVGPPLDSRVTATITSPSGISRTRQWHANNIGWLYDPTFDFVADETGRWTVDVAVLHDRPYVGNGVIPASHNTGTVLGTTGRYEFYVVQPRSPRLYLSAPQSGVITWPTGHIEPIIIRGVAPAGTTAVYYTIHDKGVVIGQGTILPDAGGTFSLTYDAVALNAIYSFISLTAHDGHWEGLSDEVKISLLALTPASPLANTVTLMGEEIFARNSVRDDGNCVYLPLVKR
jgi:hypothetical protein